MVLPNHYVLIGKKALILAIDAKTNHISTKLTTRKKKVKAR